MNYKYVDVMFGVDLGYEDYSELLVKRYKFLEEREIGRASCRERV